MLSDEEGRFSKLFESDLESSLLKDNCDQGVHVEGALLAEIKKRRRVSPKTNRKKMPNKEDESISLAQLLSQNDPFAATNASSSSADERRSNKVTARQQSSEAKHLADVLANEDPFAIIDAMANVSRNQFSSSSRIVQQSSETYFRCDEKCQGCSYCDGMDYINDIRVDQNIDEYEQAVEEEDGGVFFENDDGLAVETDDDCVEYKYYEEEEPPLSSSANPHPSHSSGNTAESIWNPNNASFWEVRQEGKALVDDALQKKKHLNSSCTSCFSALHCYTCETNMKNPSAKKSASYIKEFAMRTTLMELGNLPCSRSCKFGKDCLRRLSIGQVYELRKKFFGNELEEAPKDKERKEKAVAILTECYDSFKKTFSYRIVRLNGADYDEVCEGAFLVALGKLGNMKTNQISKSWVDAKRIVMGTQNVQQSNVRPSKDFKLQHAGGYIDFVANLFVHQDPTKSFAAMQTIGETSPLAGYGKLIVLPYDNLKQFHNEYVVHSFSRGFAAQFIAGYTTFSTAFKQRENVRFLGAKGSFNTCEICNSLNNLLKNTHKKLKHKEQIRIVQEFKRLHIAQQSIERKRLEVNKEMALEVDDSGQPLQALLFFDGMTELTGNTPKLGGNRHSKVDHIIANRVIGVEVYCGPINTVFLYHTDQMVGKGANTMIEVVRQAMSDLALELKKVGLQMPPKTSWQFDNCGENKNKTMFAYASALVELGYFDAIDMNFLIVGHTHSSIDQYFSVLSKAIKSAEFIGSPISLQALCSQAHKDRARPAVSRQLDVCYNIVDALKPYINKKIKFFQVPHCFSFRRRGNKCIMFYKLFSSHEKWLPVEPDLSTKISNNSKTSTSVADKNERVLEAVRNESYKLTVVEVQPLSCFDGKKSFLSHIGITGDAKSNYLINNKQARNKIDAIDSVLPIIAEEEIVALHNLEVRTDAEESAGHVFEQKELIKVKISEAERLLIQNAMKSVSSISMKKGYIMWIIDSVDLAPLDSIRPKLIHVGASINLSATQQSEYERLRTMHTLSNVSNDSVDPVDIEIPNNEDDEENAPLVTEENLFERTKKSFQQRAKDIVAVAKKALDHINSTKSGVTLDYTFSPDKMEFDGRCWEDRCYIAPEKIYFESRQSLPHYKLYLDLIAKEALKMPWTYFATQHIDEETMQRYQLELQNARIAAQAMKMYFTNLQKTGLAVQQGIEVVARDGYNMNTNQLVELQNLVDDERDRSKRVTIAGRGTSTDGGGRGRSGRGRGSRTTTTGRNSTVQEASLIQTSESRSQPGQSQMNPRGGGGKGGGSRGGGGRTGSRGRGGSASETVITTDSSSSSSSFSVDPKRKRCSIELCEGYCDDTTISVICDSCSAENRNLRFCPMHVPHVSHSGQLGFIDQPLAVHPVPLLQAEVDSNSSNTTVSQQERVVPRVVSASGPTETASSTATLLQSRTEGESSSCREYSTIPLSDPQLQVAAEVETSCSSSSSSATSELNNVEKKVLRLFEEGFQQSLKTNISPQLKVLGALNHSCYKEHLGIIVSHFKLFSVAIPSVSSLSKTTGREQYLNEVVKAYDEIRKGKNGV